MKIKEYQPKINVFGIGGCGTNIIPQIKANARLSKIVINADIAHLNISTTNTAVLDAAILCGRETCKGLGCGGKISQGYKAAKESFSNFMYLFSHNQINIFICGLGGGCGTGTLKFILEELKKEKDKYYNKCNIVLCTFPLDIELKRVKKAKIALKTISKYCDLLILVDMQSIFEGLTKDLTIQQLFSGINKLIIDYLTDLSKLKNKKIIEEVKIYKRKSKIVKIKSPFDFKKYFLPKIVKIKSPFDLKKYFLCNKKICS